MPPAWAPTVLAVCSGRFSLSKVSAVLAALATSGGADDEDDSGTNPKQPGHELSARDGGAARTAHRRLYRGCSVVVWRSRVCRGGAGHQLFDRNLSSSARRGNGGR